MRTKFQRIAAFLLTFVLLLGGTVSAGASSDSLTDTTIESMKDLLGAISYNEYRDGYYEKNDDGSIKRDDNGQPIWTVGEAKESIVINGVDYDTDHTDADGVIIDTYEGIEAVYLPSSGSVTWKVNIPETARYTIKIDYYPVRSTKNTSITRIFKIDEEVPFSEARFLTMSKIYKNGVYTKLDPNDPDSEEVFVPVEEFEKDIYGNQLRPNMEQVPEWRTYTFKDVDGFSPEPFQFVLEKGERLLSLDAVSEHVAIKSITLCKIEEENSYKDVMDSYQQAGVVSGTSSIKLEAEHPLSTSSQTIYAVEDRTSPLTSPSSTKAQLLNTLGGDKWQVAGQWVRYSFTVENSGVYEIAARFRQHLLDGMYSSRVLYVYSGEGVEPGALGYYDGLPYAEATELRFGYSDAWQAQTLYFLDENENAQEVKLYFEAGVTYTVEFEVTLGAMGDIVSRVQTSLAEINEAYLNIIKLTGTSPDQYRDYGFFRVMPETMISLIRQSRELYAISAELTALTGEKSDNAATLDTVAWLLNEMGTDEDDVARNLERLKNYIGTLGTWITDAKTQPVLLDYIVVQGTEAPLPPAKAGFWASLWHELSSFFQSFFRDYNHMGALTEEDVSEESLEVWLAYGRDQSQVIRTLINNDFTKNHNITVDLKLVAAGTLLPSILAKKGPDVYIGLGQSDIINYAIRGALEDVYTPRAEEFTAFTEANFSEAAMLVLGLDDAQGNPHYYGLPETQDFPMMFTRLDILANLNVEIPKTWDDLLEALPKLQANNMEIGLTADTNIYLYQMGGTLFADEGMRINLDSNVGLEAFTKMCNMYTKYSFPYQYNFANRFRTGEMPIGIGSYCATYNTLVVFATEIRGLWQFFPVPGTEGVDGKINNASVSTVTAVCMIGGTDKQDEAWTFMKWQTDADCQAAYSNEMVAILGDSAKHATANQNALDELTWTDAELTEIKKQFSNLASVPNYPGAYIVSRYTNFAFLAAYDDMAVPTDEILGYINTINKEITRKRAEFGLETLSLGETLADKRLKEARENLNSLEGANAELVDAVIKTINDAPADTKSGVEDDYMAELKAAIESLKNADATKYGTAISKLEDAVAALESYDVVF
ncbi:MAG: extracellular solute-binding protein [Clostridia bacterium]|nr:extracellular solute-binding protein [Clostridia bacterium]